MQLEKLVNVNQVLIDLVLAVDHFPRELHVFFPPITEFIVYACLSRITRFANERLAELINKDALSPRK